MIHFKYSCFLDKQDLRVKELQRRDGSEDLAGAHETKLRDLSE